MYLKTFARLSACSLIVGVAFVAQKASCLPFWDAVQYPVNANLSGLLNPEGDAWAIAGTTLGPPDVQIISTPLTYPGLECSASNSFVFGFSGTTGYPERIAINPPVNGTNAYGCTSGTIYYSMVFQIPNLGANTTGGFFCGFNTLPGTQTGNPTVFGSRIYVLKNGSGYQLGIGKSPASIATATMLPTVYSLTNTNFVVCSYTFVDGGTSNDYSQMWLNPAQSTFGTLVPPVPDATNSIGSDLQVAGGNQIESFMLRQANAQIPLVYASDLRLGYCWACVTPPAVNPAPAQPTLSIANVASNVNVISFPTNTPCFKFMTTTNLTNASTNWPIVSTGGTVVGANIVVTNTIPTNLPPTYYQIKAYQN